MELLGLGFFSEISGERGNGDRREGDQVQRSVLAPPSVSRSVLVSFCDSGEIFLGEGWMLHGPPETFWGRFWDFGYWRMDEQWRRATSFLSFNPVRNVTRNLL